jgi:SagB-type dehydrogenase family enzyme
VKNAPLVVVIVADYSRTTRKYGERGTMYVHMEAGHAAQNIHLQAVALGLASVPVGAFSEKGVAKTLSLPREMTPLYLIPVGYRK